MENFRCIINLFQCVIIIQVALTVLYYGIQLSIVGFLLREPINEFGETIINSSIDLPISHGTIRGIAKGVGGGIIGLARTSYTTCDYQIFNLFEGKINVFSLICCFAAFVLLKCIDL